MIKLLGDLKTYLKVQEITTASAVFRIHCAFTAALLMAFSLIITATQFVGKPIQCIVDGPKVLEKPITTFCWITSTFTMPDAFDRQVGKEVAHPGVYNDFDDFSARKYYTYYQWVCFVLFFQALLCYTPKFMWDAWEGGLIKSVTMGLNMSLLHDEEKAKKKKQMLQYLMGHVKRHNPYAFRYWFCELLCLLNVIGQLYLMNCFFDGEFLSYGLRVLSFSEQDQEKRVDPMVYIFPRVTKCTFHKYGGSGTIQKHDSLCILPLNIVNEKTYIFIWFWFMFLLTILSLLVLYRAIVICWPAERSRSLRAWNRMVPQEVADAVVRKTNVGDWWMLYMLAANMDPLTYRDIVTELAKKIETAASNAQ